MDNLSVATKNPTNLKNHLKTHHSTQYDEIVAQEVEQADAKKKWVLQQMEESSQLVASGKYLSNSIVHEV